LNDLDPPHQSHRCTNCDFIFTAIGIWGSGGDCIHWFADNGVPEEGTGETFTTIWEEPGEYDVKVYTCGYLRDTYTVKISERVEIIADAIGKNTGSDPIYLANDYYDEPDKRQEHYLWWIKPIFNLPILDSQQPFTLPCFGWSNHGVWVDPPGTGWTYLRFKDHGIDFWVDTNADCTADGAGRLDAVVEGIDLIAEGIDPAEEEGTSAKNYNISLNENFDQQLGSGPCYNVDHSDDTLTGDQMDEIGTITINTYTYGDNQATVRFDSGYGDNIKLFKSQTEKVFFDFDYPASEFSDTTLYVEGIESGTTTLTAILRTQEYPKVDPGYWPFQARDKIKIKVHRLNLKAVDPAPSGEDEDERDRNEICDENLIIAVNNNDSDNDGIIDKDDPEIAGGDPDFAKITLHKPAVTSESDITGNITVTIPANLNAWTTNDKTGGAAPTSYALTALPVDIYLEGKIASSAILDTEIKAEMTLNSGVKCRDSIKYTVVHLELKSIKFTSDHGVLNDNDANWTDSGTVYFEPEWIPDDSDPDTDPEQNNPISHTKNIKLTADVTVKVAPLGLTFDLVGDGPNNYVDFTKAAITSTGSDQIVSITADDNLVNQVDTLEKSISWTIKLTDFNPDYEYNAGTSGPHKIYITYGTPSGSVATEKRVNWCCQEANGESTDGGVADAIHNSLGDVDPPYEPGEKPSLGSGWPLLAGTTYGECDEQAGLMELAVELLGLSGDVRLVRASTNAGAGNCLDQESKTEGGIKKWLILDFDMGSGHNWNAFEGCCETAGSYYAVWPKHEATDDYDMLKNKIAPQQYWVKTYSDIPPGNSGWGVETVYAEEPLP